MKITGSLTTVSARTASPVSWFLGSRYWGVPGVLASTFGVLLLALFALDVRLHGVGAQTAGKKDQVGARSAQKDRLKKRVSVTFLTGKGYPPFNYIDEDNVLTGFNVDIARAICLEMGSTCDVKARPWNQLMPALQRGEADAVVASQVISPVGLRKVDYTESYYRTPGRFVALRNAQKLKITPVGLEAKKLGAVKGTTHEAYLRDFFKDSIIVAYDSAALARSALASGSIDMLFGDAMSLSFWLSGTASKTCCEFRGGAFSEPKYFGDGVGITVAKGDRQLRALLNNALAAVRASGRYEELFLRYFPIKVY